MQPNAFKNTVGQAYVLELDGADRLAYGQAFAKGLNCLKPDPARSHDSACGHCLSCRVFESGNHPDTHYVTGARSIGVDDVREQIVMPMMTQPHSYRYKVFVADKAETLTPAAQNALLKTIEEPAPYGVFIFAVSHTHTLLPTLMSRCVLVKLKEEAKPPEAELYALAEEISSNIAKLDIIETMALYKRFEQYKDTKESVMQILDMLTASNAKKITQATTNGNQPDKLWFDSIQAISHTKRALTQNGNFQLALELMLLKMSGNFQM